MTMNEAPKFGGKPVNPDIVPCLEMVLARLSWLEKRRLKASVVQGWAPSSPWSKSTHATGHAVDFATSTWSDDFIRKVVHAFQKSGFEIVLRLKGEDIGTGAPVGTEHLHAVLRGRGNAAILAELTRFGARRHIERELAMRRKS